MSFTVQSSVSITGTRPGRPDYSGDVYRSKSIYGYVLDVEENESFLFNMLIATANPGAYAFTISPLTPGVTYNVNDAFTGLPGINALAGEDYLIKEFWCNFTQPVRFQMTQAQVGGDVTCECYIPAYSTPAVIAFPVGWTRAQVESIVPASNTGMTITNLGGATATGKLWVVGFRKMGAYRWY